MVDREVFVLVGPTASGKSDVGQILAERMHAAILSADSMLVYRGMDIGTAKPPESARGAVPYLGIDLVAPDAGFDVWRYVQMVWEQMEALPPQMPVLVVGGSGLYVKALVEGLDRQLAPPEGRARWEGILAEQGVAGLQAALRARDAAVLAGLDDAQNPRRLIRALERTEATGAGVGEAPRRERTWAKGAAGTFAGLMVEPGILRGRIVERVERMYAGDALLEEVRDLVARYPALSETARQAIGYCEALEVLSGGRTVGDAKARTILRTNRLAKRQRTWFRHQASVDWVFGGDGFDANEVADRVAGIWGKHGSIRIERE